MFAAKKVLANGRVKYYVRYRNNEGRLVNYPSDISGDFYSKEACEKWIRKNKIKVSNTKKQADILKGIKQKKKYPKFQELVKRFEKAQKTEAPNSYQSSMLYLERFVLDFFLIKKGVYDTNKWYFYFEEFRDFLEEEATVLGTDELIEYSTKNHCIRTLNKFLTVMQRNHIIEEPRLLKCRPFPKHLLKTRGAKDLFSPDQYEELRNNLKLSRDFFIILYNTGMRFNELYSLSIDDIRDRDEISLHHLSRLQKLKKEVYGCIVLDSQIAAKVRSSAMKMKKRLKDLNLSPNKKQLKFARKPLKSCVDYHPKNIRVIPIFDKETWSILSEKYNVACEEYHKKTHGDNPKDYFLLDVDPTKIRAEFRKYSPHRGFHSCRHTYITKFVGEHRDMAAAREITGHRSDAFENYVHIYEQYASDFVRKTDFKPKKLKNIA